MVTMWAPDLSGRPGPLYRALADAIAAAIESGELPAGARLPPHRELAHRLGCTVGTVSRAYALADQRGLLRGEVGRGTFVRRPAAVTEAGERRLLALDGEGGGDGGGDPIDLTVNGPGLEPHEALAAAAAELAARAGPGLRRLLAYAIGPGLPEHRAAGAAWLRRYGIVDADPGRVVLTCGAHQAIAAALTAFARPGDVVLTEGLTYGSVPPIAEALHLRPHGLPMDERGLRPDALEAAVRRGGARLLLLIPTLHNPTAVTMPAERREAIAAIARAHDLIVIEDDVYGLLPRDRSAAPPIATLAPERTVYLTSVSKSIAPGLRLGFALSPPALTDRLIETQYALTLGLSPITAEIFRLWLEDGTADRLAERQREEAAARQEVAARALEGARYDGAPTGFHVWLHLPPPWSAGEFTAALRGRGVVVLPGDKFAPGPASAPPAVRVSLTAASNRERLERGLRIIAEVARERPLRERAVI